MVSSVRERLALVLATLSALGATAAVLAALLWTPEADTWATQRVHAQVLTETEGRFAAPARVPGHVAAVAGPGAAPWRDIALPHLWSRNLAPSRDALQEHAEVHWFRIALPPRGNGGDEADRHLYLPRWQTIGTVAVYADDRLVYDSASGTLYYDPDGTGPAAIRPIATLGTDTHPDLRATDVFVIA